MSKYHRAIARDGTGLSDVYDVLRAFGVSCPATAHCIKKLLMPGQRGTKTRVEDLKEARAALIRAITLAEADDQVYSSIQSDLDAAYSPAQPEAGVALDSAVR